MRLFPCCVAMLLISLAVSAELRAESRSLFREGEIGSTDDIKPPKLQVPRSRAPNLAVIIANRQGFRNFCEELDEDSRRQDMAALLDSLEFDRDECGACVLFFRIFRAACDPPSTRRARLRSAIEPAEDLEVERNRQREPSTAVIERALNLFRLLAAEPDAALEIALAIEQIELYLKNEQGISPGKRDYFSTLLTYMKLPFRPQFAILRRTRMEEETDAALDWNTGTDRLNSIFEF